MSARGWNDDMLPPLGGETSRRIAAIVSFALAVGLGKTAVAATRGSFESGGKRILIASFHPQSRGSGRQSFFCTVPAVYFFPDSIYGGARAT